MKYLIIGLGNFGCALAKELTDKGHEVIGADINERRVDNIKDKISLSYIIDITDPHSLASLPIRDIDATIVAIGHNTDASLRVIAVLKNLGIKNIFARAFDETHRLILSAMCVDKIFNPEIDAAAMYATRLSIEATNEEYKML